MILPKFTVRQALVGVLIAGVVSIVLSAAWQGKEWAIGQTAALIAAFIVASLAAVAYWIFFLFGSYLTQRSKQKLTPPTGSKVYSEEAKS